ncbi:MAG: hypothetical protein JO165_07600, partial [Candidatus Eremiobacteraeota bacterium]|nr:hypothetical protein [Candidatus Eremiobacteraeota bacterium]
MPRSVAIVLLLVYICACAPHVNERATLAALQAQLSDVPHSCVPLGWNPVPLANGVYYPGSSVEWQDQRSWLKPLWIGSIHTSELSDAETLVAYQVLERLRGDG